jgi:ABC-type polysaccharide/polyol phosphate export permease
VFIGPSSSWHAWSIPQPFATLANLLAGWVSGQLSAICVFYDHPSPFWQSWSIPEALQLFLICSWEDTQAAHY